MVKHCQGKIYFTTRPCQTKLNFKMFIMLLVILNQFSLVPCKEMNNSKNESFSFNKCEYPSVCQDCATQIENVKN